MQRALEAVAERLRDNSWHHYFSSHGDQEDEAMHALQLVRGSSQALGKYLPVHDQARSLSELKTSSNTSTSATCSAADLCLLLNAVGRMSLRLSAVGNIYHEVAKLVYDPEMALLRSSSSPGPPYHPAVGQLSFADIAEVFRMLRFNQCSSEIRLVVTALATQLEHLNRQQAHSLSSSSTCAVRGADVSALLQGMTCMSSSTQEVCRFLQALLRYLHQQKEWEPSLAEGGGVKSRVLSAGEISACLSSMSHMNTRSVEVQELLRYFCKEIEMDDAALPYDDRLCFSVDELYACLEGLSGMSVGETGETERDLVSRLINLIRARSH